MTTTVHDKRRVVPVPAWGQASPSSTQLLPDAAVSKGKVSVLVVCKGEQLVVVVFAGGFNEC